MDLRREERFPSQHQVSVWSLDADGEIHVQEGHTIDISATGASLTGLHRGIDAGEIIGIQNGSRRGRFKVVWSERNEKEQRHAVGIERLRSDQDGPTRLLFFDDKKDVADRRKALLQTLGYEYKVVCDVASALEQLREHEFEGMVLAHPVRDVDSSELLVSIRRQTNGLRIVLLSVHPHVPESLLALTDAFVYDREPQRNFVAAIERALDRGSNKTLAGRIYTRHAVRVPFTVEVLRSGVRTALHGTSADLGERGIGGAVKGELIPGEMVKVTFPLPNCPTDIQAYAIVRHRRKEFFGFEFITIDDRYLHLIRSLCAVLPVLRSS
ncbi:MAG TPA: PilZ domain-containing protein [Terriglobales bacterium]|nr:PilZ domain-containing protein [Terriglobales bacterium]